MTAKRWLGIAALALVLLRASSCAPAGEEAGPVEGARITGATLDEESAGDATPLTVQVERARGPVGIDFRGTLVQGSVRLELLTPEGTVFWESAFSDLGPFAVNTVVEPPEPGGYPLQLAWDGPVQAVYNMRWQPGEIEVPTVSPVILLAGMGMIVVAAGYVVYAATHKLGWAYLGLGAAAWVGTVILKFAWAVPINPQVYDALTGTLPEGMARPVFALYVGALTGVFEVVGTWLLLRYTKLGRVPWGRALAFGIGFGAVEALLLGINSLAGVLTAILAPSTLPVEALEQIVRQSSALYIVAPTWERFFTVLIHIAANVCLFHGIARKQTRWLWLAFGVKTAIDTVAAWAQFGLLATAGGLWAVEVIVAVFGIASWLGTRWMRDHYAAFSAP